MRRSWLFFPADNERFAAKALAGPADALIFDLEDSVVPARKEDARAQVVQHTQDPGNAGRGLFVRVNGLDTPYALSDLVTVVGPGLDGVVLPKIDSAADVRIADWLLTNAERAGGLPGGSVSIVALIETAAGLVHLGDILHASPRVTTVAYGCGDFAADSGMAGQWAGRSETIRTLLTAHSREAGCEPPVDSVTMAVDDLDELRIQAEQARHLGFQGKLCVHPDQVDAVNEVFTPQAATVDWAHRVLDAAGAAEACGRGAVKLDGTLVDRATVAAARRILETSRALADHRAHR
ncbi:HpcH/HpaI aldolase/citrate lyase family protein [Streptantibioticus cattleyicolor]|uniref:Citrate lyase beta chain n=1 Tax=Streptantibioticus cattleyicolor (strain ATCC 35852 / DSM 46488 / JCM 4925 / NBRC 14057 / NRRL 8057) TaxID=1003195 RepID=F8JK31_STREN|nr:CoA ester lyase [Streptantibioticus cattleyicolor]AEW99834.1 citrate lyase beta chain [Streptantibioticus cattleyicolor NRRL 8057 = DSM 46488]CCB71130.1 Citrate lyase beta chain [Streptantibioticus cattleyicolor NRRL 8057 = DSM 46488]